MPERARNEDDTAALYYVFLALFWVTRAPRRMELDGNLSPSFSTFNAAAFFRGCVISTQRGFHSAPRHVCVYICAERVT